MSSRVPSDIKAAAALRVKAGERLDKPAPDWVKRIAESEGGVEECTTCPCPEDYLLCTCPCYGCKFHCYGCWCEPCQPDDERTAV